MWTPYVRKPYKINDSYNVTCTNVQGTPEQKLTKHMYNRYSIMSPWFGILLGQKQSAIKLKMFREKLHVLYLTNGHTSQVQAKWSRNLDGRHYHANVQSPHFLRSKIFVMVYLKCHLILGLLLREMVYGITLFKDESWYTKTLFCQVLLNNGTLYQRKYNP